MEQADKWARPERIWVVAWPCTRSAHFTEAARDRAVEPMPSEWNREGKRPVVTEYVPRADFDALVKERDEARALLEEARNIVAANPTRTERGGWVAWPVLARIDAHLKEPTRG